MKRTILKYRFYNPNSVEDTADFLCKLMIEVNAGKVERAIEKAALYAENSEYIPEVMAEVSNRVVNVGSEKILPVAAIYDANASGKSL